MRNATVAFVLTMPGNASWDGRWSGDGKIHARTRSLPGLKAKELDGQDFYHSFGDGWLAMVRAKIVDAKGRRAMDRASDGFCGYEWMIDSIVKHGRIES